MAGRRRGQPDRAGSTRFYCCVSLYWPALSSSLPSSTILARRRCTFCSVGASCSAGVNILIMFRMRAAGCAPMLVSIPTTYCSHTRSSASNWSWLLCPPPSPLPSSTCSVASPAAPSVVAAS